MNALLTALVLIFVGSFSFSNAQNSYLVKDINPGNMGSDPNNFIAAAGLLYFVADDGVNGRQLWKTDGTEAGTQIVRILSNQGIDNFTNVQGKIFFTLQNNNKTYLWKTDGTADGTCEVIDFEKLGLVFVRNFINVNGLLLFAAHHSQYGGWWRTDGTPEGTYMIGHDSASRSTNFIHLDGTLFYYFQGYDRISELWRTNGTKEGTHFIRNIIPEISGMIDVNNTLYFVSGSHIWKSDGTSAGTIPIINTENPISYLTTNNKGEIYFVKRSSNSQNELWKSNGTQVGTYKLTSLPNAYLSRFKVIENRVFFVSTVNGEFELFVSDGTEEGTGLLKNIYLNHSSNPKFFTEVDGMLYFITDHPNGKTSEIWNSNGTSEGTRRIDSSGNFIYDYPDRPSVLKYANGLLYSRSTDKHSANQFGWELWAVDIGKITDIVDSESPITKNSLRIYPNPFENSATISVTGDILPDTEYILFDVLGREVRRFKTELSHFTFDRSSLNAGMYTLQLSNKSGMVHQRVVITH